VFPTTRRSVVLALGSDDAEERTRAFDTLVALYWRPLYKYARVAWGRGLQDCEDLTQSFFARAVETESLSAFDPAKASFRTFLRMLFDRHSANEAKAAQRLKRGWGTVRIDFADAEAELHDAPSRSPEELFHQEWVRSVFALAIERLRGDVSPIHFALFEAYDLSEDRSVSYRELSERVGIPQTSVTNHLAATRRRFREIVLETLREATATEQEFRAEARALLGVEA
jgi:RNA polymerase sigma factor (sigma-70 family)